MAETMWYVAFVPVSLAMTIYEISDYAYWQKLDLTLSVVVYRALYMPGSQHALLNRAINESSPSIRPVRTSKANSTMRPLEHLEVFAEAIRAPACPGSFSQRISRPVMSHVPQDICIRLHVFLEL
jgi:hypothetical protein